MIVVAGESLVDLLPTGEGAFAPSPGGGPYNVARALARLDVPVAFVGGMGEDRFGRTLRAGLAADGVVLAGVVPSARPTMLAVAELDAGSSAAYRFYADGTAAANLTAEAALAAMRAVVERQPITALHVGSLGLALEPLADAVEALLAEVAEDAIVMVDPNWRPGAVDDEATWRDRLRRALRRADVVKLSVDDLAHLEAGASIDESARDLLTARTRCVIVTDGAAPVRVFVAGAELAIAPPAVTVVDTVGAGDAFGAGFLAWCVRNGIARTSLGDEETARAAAEFAAVVASRACTRAGAQSPRLAELGDPIRVAG